MERLQTNGRGAGIEGKGAEGCKLTGRGKGREGKGCVVMGRDGKGMMGWRGLQSGG